MSNLRTIILHLSIFKFTCLVICIVWMFLTYKRTFSAFTYSCNLAVVASWSQRGSSAPGAEIPPWQPPSGALGRSALAEWSRCTRTRGAGHPTPTTGTWVQDTCRGLKRVLDAGDLGYPVWGLFRSEGVRPAGTACPHGGRRPGCLRGCRYSDPGRGLGSPGWSHQRAGRQFWSFSISPWRLDSGGLQSLTKTNASSLASAHLCRASEPGQRSLFRSQTHMFSVSSQEHSGWTDEQMYAIQK